MNNLVFKICNWLYILESKFCIFPIFQYKYLYLYNNKVANGLFKREFRQTRKN